VTSARREPSVIAVESTRAAGVPLNIAAAFFSVKLA
jgi:hypothetical protein